MTLTNDTRGKPRSDALDKDHAWEDLYRRFRAFEGSWAPGGQYPPDNRLRTQVMSALRGERAVPRPPEIDERAWVTLAELGRECRDLLDDTVSRNAIGNEADSPLDGCYHLAVRLLTDHASWQQLPPPHHRYYRGDGGTYTVTPGAYRGRGYASALRAHQRVRHFVHDVRKTRPDLAALEDAQLVSVAQHYIGATWMLDFTRNPFIGLFFATYVEDEATRQPVGVLRRIAALEWDHLSDDGKSLLGPLKVIEAPGAARVGAQEWASITAPHPVMLKLFLPDAAYFRQHPGRIFRDQDLSPPVAPETVYLLPNDPLRTFAAEWKQEHERDHGCFWEPLAGEPELPAALAPLEPPALLALMNSWLEPVGAASADDTGSRTRDLALLAWLWALLIVADTTDAHLATLALRQLRMRMRQFAGVDSPPLSQEELLDQLYDAMRPH